MRPILEYASVVWDPVGEGNQSLRYELEMVQRRAARFVSGDWRRTSSPSKMIKDLQWKSLENRRYQSRLIFMHKYLHKNLDIPETLAVKGRSSNTSFKPINARIQCYANSFVPATVRDWNMLPPHVRNEKDENAFKTKLSHITA